MKTDPRLPYTEIDDGFLPPRDPVLGYIKCGSKESTPRYTQAGKPWLAPTRLLDPARFEITTREKKTKKVKGQGSASGEEFTLDLGYVRDAGFHELEGVGPSPSSLRIRLLYPTWKQNLIAFLGAWGGREWVCRGNGVEATDIKRGACVCPCPRLVQFSGKYEGTPPNDGVKYKDGNAWKQDGVYPCKPHAVLNVILEAAGVFGGFWAFKTTSYETISNLTKSLRMFEEMFGRIDGLPLELRVMAATKQIPGGGTTTQPIVTLVLPASMDGARQIAKDAADESRKYLPAGGELDETKYLAAVVSEMEEEAEAYAGEFMPAEVIEDEEVVEEEREPELGRAAPADHHPPVTPERPASAETARVPEEVKDGPLESNESTQMATDERSTDAPTLQGQPADDSDRNEPKPKPKGADYVLAEKVLVAAGWRGDALKFRLEHHEKGGNLEELLDRLERHEPDAWAKVAALDLFEGEPEDGLGS